jgi:hypothetical protein
MNKNVIEQYNERKQKALQTQLMPAENIRSIWFATAKTALWLTSPMTLGITPSDLERLYRSNQNNLTLMDFAILSNNLEAKSATDLKLNMDDYLHTLVEGEASVKKWQAIVAGIDESIKQQLAQEALKLKEQDVNQPVGSFTTKIAEA